MKINYKQVISDILLLNLSLCISLLLLYQGNITPGGQELLPLRLIIYTFFSIASFYFFGVYNRLWYFAGLGELKTILKAVTLSTFFCCITFYQLLSWNGTILFWIISLFTITLSKYLSRMTRLRKDKEDIKNKKKVLLVGAGGAGSLVARALQENNSHLYPVGFIDDDRNKLGMKLCNLPVLGTREQLPGIVKRLNISEIIITMPSAPAQAIKELINIGNGTGARLKIIPSVLDYIGASRGKERLRDVDVEDLLGREPVEVNLEQIAGYIKGKVVLVTGAGGSIGSELSRQVASFDPDLIILLGHGENTIFEIKQHLEFDFPHIKQKAKIADIKDWNQIENIFSMYEPDVVFHAAAHKHVPLMEDNPEEAYYNNVFGTFNVAYAACIHSAEKFILISTDKAVNPSSVMGKTKRRAEELVQELNGCYKTNLAAVRFGNVLGSRGSVIPHFKKQIERGGPVTVTHPDMVRYFMTIPEAVQLVIQAGALTTGGEVFFLDMGKPVKIVDLARELITLSGYVPDQDIEIKYTGVRPGEKLIEELWIPKEENIVRTTHSRIYRIKKLKGNQSEIDFHMDGGD